ncbi:MAG: SGNH/GDSL hydrolase family protein [Fimbriimonas sp.]|nr:SGNH/GDSL hydrolase family protein [Fimbriimonas sp.]
MISLFVMSAGGVPQTYAQVPSATDRERFGAGIQRTMRLLATSTPKHRNTVRVLFYGQSITEQDWSRQVADWLRSKYPNANLIIENRAIGGHSSQLLWRTAEADLYPFQPDLLIFHVYGSHLDYEKIVRNVLERTTSDVLIQSDHITKPEELVDPSTKPEPTMSSWSAWWNQVFLPDLVKRLGHIELIDQRVLWRRYLNENHLSPDQLLKDGVHLNDRGCYVMAQIVEQHLVYRPDLPVTGLSKVQDFEPHWTGNRLVMNFVGNRIDLLPLVTDSGRKVKVLIDGMAPSSMPELYGVTRVSPWPGTSWPLILRTSAKLPLLLEDWAVSFHDVSFDGKSFSFDIVGSKTGPDGEGKSDAHFESKSGRVIIEPDDWNLAYCKAVFKSPVPPDLRATWSVVPHFVDELTFPIHADTTIESPVTVAQGLANCPHVLELEAVSKVRPELKAIRVFHPPL